MSLMRTVNRASKRDGNKNKRKKERNKEKKHTHTDMMLVKSVPFVAPQLLSRMFSHFSDGLKKNKLGWFR